MADTPPPVPKELPHSFWLSKPFRILVVLAVLGLSVAIFALRKQFAEMAAIGYPGIFLVSLLGNATIVLPAPSLALVFAMGSALPPLFVGLAAGAGEALGELTGYAAGFSGRAVIEDRKTFLRLEAWMKRAGGITTFVLSAIPNPFVRPGRHGRRCTALSPLALPAGLLAGQDAQDDVGRLGRSAIVYLNQAPSRVTGRWMLEV